MVKFRVRFLYSKEYRKEGSGWTVDATGPEDVGDGYYADYPSRQRAKKATKDLALLGPVTAVYPK
jgi:hypothetical protein